MNYEVDLFVPRKRVTSCQLYAKWNGQQEQSTELLYSMKLVGAKEPFDFIHSPASKPHACILLIMASVSFNVKVEFYQRICTQQLKLNCGVQANEHSVVNIMV